MAHFLLYLLGKQNVIDLNVSALQATVMNLTNLITALGTSLSAEISRATSVEATLTTNIGTANTNLAVVTSNLNNEITARTALGTSLSAEISRATSVENTLMANVAMVTANLTAEIAAGTSGVACNSGSSSSGSLQQEYWIDNSVAVNETAGFTYVVANQNNYTLKVLGIGFASYYHPVGAIICIFIMYLLLFYLYIFKCQLIYYRDFIAISGLFSLCLLQCRLCKQIFLRNCCL